MISPPKLITIDAIIKRIIADVFFEKLYNYALLNKNNDCLIGHT
jgi:hypothetical protein